jgi:DNA-directed RNA polymerase specialized sigma24 family protein
MSRKRRYGFDNTKMTILMERYSKNTKNLELRNKIIRRSLPLIDAVVAKKRYFVKDPEKQKDLKQEMALKLIKALPKYQSGRSNAFAFVWTVLCNIAISKNEWLSKSNSLSLSTDEGALQEAESQLHSVFQSPENQHILNSIGHSLQMAFSSNGFVAPRKKLHGKALSIIRRSIASGELFFKRTQVLRELKHLGLNRRDIQGYLDYTLVVTRKRLLLAKANSDAIERPEIDAVLPEHSAE